MLLVHTVETSRHFGPAPLANKTYDHHYIDNIFDSSDCSFCDFHCNAISIGLIIGNKRINLGYFSLFYQDVDPVPVLTHSPELLVFVRVSLPLIAICRYDTRADRVSPINTCTNVKLGLISFNTVFDEFHM